MKHFVELAVLLAICSLVLITAGCGITNPHTVSSPNRPSGASSGETGQSLTYSTGGASCSRGHSVQYRFDWGDGTYSGWSTSRNASKTWYSSGTYAVRAQARCSDDTTVQSSWSSTMTVTVTGVSTSCVGVRQLLDEFEANEVAAQLKYGGRRFHVCGYVDSVRVSDFTGRPYVVLTDSPTAFRLRWVFCDFPAAAMSELAQLNKGDSVVISGYFDIYLLGSVWIEDCRLE